VAFYVTETKLKILLASSGLLNIYLPAHAQLMADTSPLLSIGQIAVLINRSKMTVHRRIRANGIEPALLLSVGGARYDPSVIEQLGSFKRPNSSYTRR
jgi:hypothetical protein